MVSAPLSADSLVFPNGHKISRRKKKSAQESLTRGNSAARPRIYIPAPVISSGTVLLTVTCTRG